MKFDLPYGESTLSIEIPSKLEPVQIIPHHSNPAPEPIRSILNALDDPLNFDWGLHQGVRTVGIAINDKTRPVPLSLLLPPLLSRIAGLFPASQITLYAATGTHTPMPKSELEDLLSFELPFPVRVVSHDCDDRDEQLYLGQTSRLTPVWVNRGYYLSEMKMVVGDMELHHFAGFSGGAKAAAIGLSSRWTINTNHHFLVDPKSTIGEFAENPLRQDIEEIGQMMEIHFALNGILDDKKRLIHAIAGRPADVIKTGIPLVWQESGVDDQGEFDIVIASAGGYPKDINFYQAQKALTHASMFCKPGGSIILVAECREGSGSQGFERYVVNFDSPRQILEDFPQRPFSIGPHKAFQLARLAEQFNIRLVSSIPLELARKLLLNPAGSLSQALSEAMSLYPSGCRIAVLPHATNTVPRPILC